MEFAVEEGPPLEEQEDGDMGGIERKKREISCKSRAKDWDKA